MTGSVEMAGTHTKGARCQGVARRRLYPKQGKILMAEGEPQAAVGVLSERENVHLVEASGQEVQRLYLHRVHNHRVLEPFRGLLC